MTKRKSPTPSGTVEGQSVYPLLSELDYNQNVQPVTILSSIDSQGKQQPFTVAEEGGVVNAFDNQGGEISIANGGSGYTDTIDCSLYDSIIFFFWLNEFAPLLNDRISVAVAMGGAYSADDGINIETTGTKLPLVSPLDNAEFIDFANDATPLAWAPTSQTATNPTGVQPLVIRGLHGLKFRLRFQNNDALGTGGAITAKTYVKRLGFKGA